MQNQDSNLRPKTSASFYDKTEATFFYEKSKVATVDSLVTMEGFW